MRQQPTVFLVASVVDGELDFNHNLEGIYSPIPLPHSNDEFTDITTAIRTCESNIFIQGIFVVSTDEKGHQYFYKIISKHYHSLSNLRGNAYDIPTRYTELRLGEPSRVNEFAQLFCEYSGVFMFIESRLEHIINHIHLKYTERFVQNKYAPVHPALYPFMKYVRQYAMQNEMLEISLDTVRQCLVAQPGRYVMQMINTKEC